MMEQPNILVIITDQQRKSQHFDSALTPEQKVAGLTWDDLYLPSMKKLKGMGVTFNNSIIAASMCSPSRAAFMTSSYSCQNGVPHVGGHLAASSAGDNIPNLCRLMQQEGYHVHWKGKWHLGTTDGTDVWPGANHPAKPTSLDGFLNSGQYPTTSLGWNPPDAGISMGTDSTLGAGKWNNDDRFLQDGSKTKFVAKAVKGDVGSDITYAPMPDDSNSFNPAGNANTQGMLASLDSYFEMYQDETKAGNNPEPFCLMASFVNPHDVHVFDTGASNAGYPLEADIKNNGFLANCFDKGNANNPPASQGLNIQVPPNAIHEGNKHHRSFLEKPTCQQYMEEDYDQKSPGSDQPGYQLGASSNLKSNPNQYANGGMSDAQRFINFYGYLHQIVDRDISQLLAWFEQDDAHKSLLDNTIIIRYADHGEQGLSHGIREKGMICYEETINVPMIVANPSFKPSTVDHLISHIDIVPTIADMIGVTIDDNGQLPSSVWDTSHPIYGKSFKSLIPELNGNVAGGSIHEHGVVFCYDDIWSYGNTPCYIRCLRTSDWVYAIYYDHSSFEPVSGIPVQYELYNLNDASFSTASPVLQASSLQINNLANLSISATGLTSTEVTAIESQWKTMHYTLVGLMANSDVADQVPTMTGVSIPTKNMVNALPFGLMQYGPIDAMYKLWNDNVMPDFKLKQ